jgi:hypothetical protein
MRRVTLTVFFCLAACGGGVKQSSSDAVPSSADMRALYQQYLFTADAVAVVADFAQAFSQDAIDSCLAAWVDDLGGQSGRDGPISKPDVKEFRSFLRECLGGPAPVRGASASMRISGDGSPMRDVGSAAARAAGLGNSL